MSKAATEKEPSQQNFDIDKAALHTIYVTSNTHQLLYHGLRHFPFLSSVSGKFNCFILFFDISLFYFPLFILFNKHILIFIVFKTVCLDMLISNFFLSNLEGCLRDQLK